MNRTLVTACNLAYAPGARGLLRSLREFHPEVRAICLAPSEEVSALQNELGALAEVKPIVRLLAGVPEGLVYRLITARVFTPTFGGDASAWVDCDIVFAAPAPELWDVPSGKVNVVADPGYSLGEMVPEDALTRFFTPDSPFQFSSKAFNSGVFALRPADWMDLPERFEKELAKIGYGFYPIYYDQPVLNRMFQECANWLPLAFNATSTNEVGIPPGVRLVHFTNMPGKPWKTEFPRYEAAYYYWLRYGEQERRWHRLASAKIRIAAHKPVKLWRRVVRKVRYLTGGLRDDKAKANVGIFAPIQQKEVPVTAIPSTSDGVKGGT